MKTKKWRTYATAMCVLGFLLLIGALSAINSNGLSPTQAIIQTIIGSLMFCIGGLLRGNGK